MSLYLWLDILSLSVPLLVSFHPRIALHRQWGKLIPAILLALVPYILWDIYFTENGIWRFNEDYLIGVDILSLPIEEWLFFICIPYACIFTHEAILVINPRLRLSAFFTDAISVVLMAVVALIAMMNYDKAYTIWDMSFTLVILALVFFTKRKLLSTFYVTFLFMLIPFFIVNGILTGTGIMEEVVWYNNSENLGIRIMTIPVEDTAYAFSMILLGLFLFRVFQRKPY